MDLNIWNDYPELKIRIEKIFKEQRRLQEMLGLEPKTLEQRIIELKEKERLKAEEVARQQRIQAELAKIKTPAISRLPIRRPFK